MIDKSPSVIDGHIQTKIAIGRHHFHRRTTPHEEAQATKQSTNHGQRLDLHWFVTATGTEIEEQDQKDENQEKQDQEKQEKQDQDQEQKQEQEEGKENEEQKEGEQKEDPMEKLMDKLKEMNIPLEKAQMILEAMKNNETQYVQQKKRKATERKRSDKPDW